MSFRFNIFKLVLIVLYSEINYNRVVLIFLVMNCGYEYCYKEEGKEFFLNIGNIGVSWLFIISVEKYIWMRILFSWVSFKF